MSNTNFTPGPWDLRTVSCEDDLAIVISDGVELANLVHPEYSGIDYETTKANGQLIAVAPDMYRKIEENITYFNMIRVHHGMTFSFVERAENLIRENLNLLAKAKGEIAK